MRKGSKIVAIALTRSLQHDLAASLHEADAHTLGRRGLRTTFSDHTATAAATTAGCLYERSRGDGRQTCPVAEGQGHAVRRRGTDNAEMAMLRFGVKRALGADVDTIEAQSQGVDTNLTADEVARGDKVCFEYQLLPHPWSCSPPPLSKVSITRTSSLPPPPPLLWSSIGTSLIPNPAFLKANYRCRDVLAMITDTNQTLPPQPQTAYQDYSQGQRKRRRSANGHQRWERHWQSGNQAGCSMV